MKYDVTITAIGEVVQDLLDSSGDLILFDTCPIEALGEVSVMHTIGEVGDIQVGDTVSFGNKSYTIMAIGDEVLNGLKEIGHCRLKFNEMTSTCLPGQIILKGDGLPELKVGEKIIFE
ncbi:PTS glucitol/sorbitol transporter subunit IIA [Anaerosinus sp.]|uniref:PTS glucitol/sorbitol transporter subunit IIA n=1 Tax=Selenobaculum sp. TaxID=3074374 RepID=UPI0015B06336